MTRISLDQVETSERFYRIPKVFTEETSYYSLMSLEAKFAYGLLKDRFELSIKNKWIDKNGFVYLNFTVESLANVLSCGAKKAIRIKKELTAYGLLEEERPGCNKPNRLYVLNVDSTRKCQNDNTNKVSDSKEVSKRQFKKCQNDTSRNGEMTIQEVSKRQPNDTEYNDTDFIDTKSEDEEEKIKKENLNESQEQDWKQAVKNKKREILQNFGELIGQSLIDEAIDNTSNNLFDISYYDSYLFVALQKAVEKYQKLTVEPQKELSETIVSFSPSLLNPDNFK